MTRAWFVPLLLLLLAAPAAAAPPPGYTLVWSDEFESGTAPDPRKWSWDTEANAQRWWHDEAEYYSANRPENARIENGHLVIEVRREDLKRMKGYAGQQYSSARLITRDKAEWTYGFFEIRAKLPCNRGGWPAIWLVGPAWPAGGEIDIMEQLGFDPTTIYGTLHSPETEQGHAHDGDKTIVPDACAAFHDYQAEWTPAAITLLVDGKPYYHFDKPAHATAGNWPFATPEFLILNVAMGGAWAGQKGIDDNALPARMEVDYVRVYRKP
ncbi:MAG TPA: glycoside hydrolase family 16 protein [Allosphingosinicella sp.]|nr:glycoside hydrolase family 16 protein [Allosphingosinicella sp.]